MNRINLTFVKHIKRTFDLCKFVRKNHFARERTEKAIVITKKRNFHHIKRRILSVQYRFYFFDITYAKKIIHVKKIEK